NYTLAAGYVWSREQVRNTFISDDSFRSFPLRRDQHGLYAENRFQLGGRLFLTAGLRVEIIDTPSIPGNALSRRPLFPAHVTTQPNPKIAAAFAHTPSTRLHGSFGTGIRPPGGFDLAFTNNPELRPEKTRGFDAGVEQRFGRLLSLDLTGFHNRYDDLIVSLGGSLAALGSFRTANLANSRARGLELLARFRPAAPLDLSATYMYLATEILSLDGSTGLAPQFFRAGQALPRRPPHSGTLHAAYSFRRLSAHATAHFRGETLDTEPSFGASGGFFPNPGYTSLGLSLNYRLGPGVTLYGNLRNALNQRYEEVFGFPSPRLNFIAGMRWRLSRE
ncbi:MAG: TonB-dependent receptor domain-containing protein, partial [Bryobacteraceae bacterium]